MKKRLYLAPMVIFRLIVGVLSIVNSTHKIYVDRYNMQGIEQGKTVVMNFSSGQKEAVVQTQSHWVKGDVKYGVKQTKGNAGKKSTIYLLSYKAPSGGWKDAKQKITFNKNDIYYGLWNLHKTNGKDKYSYSIKKLNDLNIKSSMVIDFMVK